MRPPWEIRTFWNTVNFEPVSTGTFLGLSAATWAGIGAATGTAFSAFSAIQQGQAANQQAKFQSEVYRQQADRAKQEAAAREDDYRRAASRDLATRRALLGASGVEPGEGSPLLVSEDMAGEAELQALRLRSGGQAEATRLEQQASLARSAGRNAQTSGYTRAGGSLLSGIGSAGYYFSGGVPTRRYDD